MGISIIHGVILVGLVLSIMRTFTYWILASNPDSRVGKFLAYTYC
jgi:hypothetical protein